MLRHQVLKFLKAFLTSHIILDMNFSIKFFTETIIDEVIYHLIIIVFI